MFFLVSRITAFIKDVQDFFLKLALLVKIYFEMGAKKSD